jgi:hypothetical protein
MWLSPGETAEHAGAVKAMTNFTHLFLQKSAFEYEKRCLTSRQRIGPRDMGLRRA